MGEHGGDALDHAGLLRPFLASRWRSRYDKLRLGSRQRTELNNNLAHRYDEVLDWRYARPAVAAALEQELRRLGAAGVCYCLCDGHELDGREVSLGEALAALRGRGPVLLVCRPGVLAYFEPEYESGAGRRYIIQRPDAEPV